MRECVRARFRFALPELVFVCVSVGVIREHTHVCGFAWACTSRCLCTVDHLNMSFCL